MTDPTTRLASVPKFDLKKLPSQVRGLTALYYRLGYQFSNINLPILALMHRSYDSEYNYERLEFLGDALLGAIIAEALLTRYPDYNEGRLTRLRASLVREATLVIIAKQLGLSEHLILGVGERKGGGRQRASILADTVEALIGAIFLDSGSFDTVKACVLTWFDTLITEVGEQVVIKDAKSRLQELMQANQLPLPRYETLHIHGNAPDQVFTIACQVDDSLEPPHTEQVTAKGESRRIAEQRGAELMLKRLAERLPAKR